MKKLFNHSVRLNIHVSEKMRKDVKVYCAKHDKTISEWFREMVEEKLQGGEK